MRRGITATALVAALALAATACGSDDETGSKSSGELSGTVTWWDTSSVGSEDKVFKKLAEGFEKKRRRSTSSTSTCPSVRRRTSSRTPPRRATARPT